MKAAFIEQHGGPEVLQYGDLAGSGAGAGRGGGRYGRRQRQRRRLEGARRRIQAIEHFPTSWGAIFPAWSAPSAKASRIFASATRCSASATSGQEGAYAEKIAIKAAIVAKKPDGLSHVDAAALALTGLTAMSAIEETLKLQRGETILIQGGAGGVASFAIQLAKHIGARVITTASAAEPSTMCAASAPMRSSTTTRAISRRL